MKHPHIQLKPTRAGRMDVLPTRRPATTRNPMHAATIPDRHDLARIPVHGSQEQTREGRPLPGRLRARMQRSFRQDFSDVRIHEGGEAAALGADAFARGTDLFFKPGAFDPSSRSGQELIGHELAHVVQQRSAGVATAQGKNAVVNANPALEAEADRAGAEAAAGEPATVKGSSMMGLVQCGKNRKKGLSQARAKQQQIRDYKKTQGGRKVKLPSGEEDAPAELLPAPEAPPHGYGSWHEYYSRRRDGDGGGGGGIAT